MILTAKSVYKEFESGIGMNKSEIQAILDSNEIKKHKLKIRSFPLNSSSQNVHNVFENFSKILEKDLKKFEIVEREEIGRQTEG